MSTCAPPITTGRPFSDQTNDFLRDTVNGGNGCFATQTNLKQHIFPFRTVGRAIFLKRQGSRRTSRLALREPRPTINPSGLNNRAVRVEMFSAWFNFFFIFPTKEKEKKKQRNVVG